MKHNIFISFLIIIFLCIFNPLQLTAQPNGFKKMANQVSFKTNLEQTVKKVSTIESDFAQNQFMTAFSDQMTMKGHFWFKKENKLRWQYNEPMKYTIVMNGTKMWIKDEQKVSEFDLKSNRMFKEINDIMSSCLQGNILSKTDKFKIACYESPKFYLVSLTPIKKDMKGFLKNIELYINKKDYSVDRLKMIEPSGDYTSIEFLNKKLNHEIPDTNFSAN